MCWKRREERPCVLNSFLDSLGKKKTQTDRRGLVEFCCWHLSRLFIYWKPADKKETKKKCGDKNLRRSNCYLDESERTKEGKGAPLLSAVSEREREKGCCVPSYRFLCPNRKIKYRNDTHPALRCRFIKKKYSNRTCFFSREIII